MAALEKAGVEFHQDGKWLGVSISVRQAGEVMVPLPELPCFPATGGATPFGRGNQKCEIWESWCFAPRWLAVSPIAKQSNFVLQSTATSDDA